MAPASLPRLRSAGRLPGGRLRATAMGWRPRLRGCLSRRGDPDGTLREAAPRCVPGASLVGTGLKPAKVRITAAGFGTSRNSPGFRRLQACGHGSIGPNPLSALHTPGGEGVPVCPRRPRERAKPGGRKRSYLGVSGGHGCPKRTSGEGIRATPTYRLTSLRSLKSLGTSGPRRTSGEGIWATPTYQEMPLRILSPTRLTGPL
ncbi:MAG: hypothetical protein RLZZ440_169 [Planctomycetota bacterium]